LDALPPANAPVPTQSAEAATYAAAPGDIYPRDAREAELCHEASQPDWLYLGGLLALDAGSIWLGSSNGVKTSDSLVVRLSGPAMIGLTWGATVGGAWLALPKCSPTWVGESPREGGVRSNLPLAISLAVLAGATAPIVNGIAVGHLPLFWTEFESQMHIVVAGVAGFAGAFLPYLLPPRTWAAAREIEHLRVEVDGRGDPFVGFVGTF
jgi:hypothetical protein